MPKYKQNNSTQKNSRKNLRNWIIDSKRPFEIVKDKYMVKAFVDLDNRVVTMTPFMMRKDIMELAREVVETTKGEFSKVETFT